MRRPPLATRRAGKGNRAPAASQELADPAPAPAPKRPPFPRAAPTQPSPWRPLCLGGAGSVFQAPRPGLKGGRGSKVKGSYRGRVREAALGMRIALIQRGEVWLVALETWDKLGAGPTSRQDSEGNQGRVTGG